MNRFECSTGGRENANKCSASSRKHFTITTNFIIFKSRISTSNLYLSLSPSLSPSSPSFLYLWVNANVFISSLQVTAIENYMRLCTSQDGTQQWFARSTVTAILLLIWFIGSVASGLQYVYDVSFDYCVRKQDGHSTLLPFETGEFD
jgi:hypothetical protein